MWEQIASCCTTPGVYHWRLHRTAPKRLRIYSFTAPDWDFLSFPLIWKCSFVFHETKEMKCVCPDARLWTEGVRFLLMSPWAQQVTLWNPAKSPHLPPAIPIPPPLHMGTNLPRRSSQLNLHFPTLIPLWHIGGEVSFFIRQEVIKTLYWLHDYSIF